jgi:hypothetical protein
MNQPSRQQPTTAELVARVERAMEEAKRLREEARRIRDRSGGDPPPLAGSMERQRRADDEEA